MCQQLSLLKLESRPLWILGVHITIEQNIASLQVTMYNLQSREFVQIKKALSNAIDNVHTHVPIQQCAFARICININYIIKIFKLRIFHNIDNYKKNIHYNIKIKTRCHKPKRNKSKLLFGMYSYINIFSSPSMQHPKILTRFLC